MEGIKVKVFFQGEFLGTCSSLIDATTRTNVTFPTIKRFLDTGKSCRGYSFKSIPQEEKEIEHD